jgi:prepilin-type N-terminal cleavage/methylation domain-containing protein
MSRPMSAATSSRRRTLAHMSRGYTAIEVMLAMTVLLISMAGVMSMQRASIQGNQDARKLDIANSIARTWLDRLVADGASWNATNGLAFTTWLGPFLGLGFQVPATAGATSVYSPAFDILGRDLVTTSDLSTIFCTHINVQLVAEGSAPGGAPAPVLLQATVLVFWPKNLLGGGTPATNPMTMCNAGTGVTDVAAAEALNPGTYHMIYVTESIRRSS